MAYLVLSRAIGSEGISSSVELRCPPLSDNWIFFQIGLLIIRLVSSSLQLLGDLVSYLAMRVGPLTLVLEIAVSAEIWTGGLELILFPDLCF